MTQSAGGRVTEAQYRTGFKIRPGNWSSSISLTLMHGLRFALCATQDAASDSAGIGRMRQRYDPGDPSITASLHACKGHEVVFPLQLS